MTDSHSTFPFSISGDPPSSDSQALGQSAGAIGRKASRSVNFIWGWGPPIGIGRPFLLTGAKAAATCSLRPGGLTLGGVLPCPVGGMGAERAQPARGDWGWVFSLQRLPHRSRDLGAHLPAGPHATPVVRDAVHR